MTSHEGSVDSHVLPAVWNFLRVVFLQQLTGKPRFLHADSLDQGRTFVSQASAGADLGSLLSARGPAIVMYGATWWHGAWHCESLSTESECDRRPPSQSRHVWQGSALYNPQSCPPFLVVFRARAQNTMMTVRTAGLNRVIAGTEPAPNQVDTKESHHRIACLTLGP